MNIDFQLIDSGWDDALNGALAKDHSELRLVCPFIKEGVAKRLLRFGLPRPLNLITRFNLRDFCDGVSDISALRILLEEGAKIRGVKNLHAKLYLFGASRVMVTSANLTLAALERNHEFGFIADKTEIIYNCREYFDKLWKQAGPNLTRARLDGWDKKLTSVLSRGSRPERMANLTDEGVNVGVKEPPIVLPPIVAEAPQSFVKFFGNSQDRYRRSKLVIDEVKRSGCHWACSYPKLKRPRQVKDGAVIFMGRLVKEPNDILIYGRAIGMRHQVTRDDATPEDIKLRKWKKNWPHHIRVHHAEFVAEMLENAVSLFELMDELKSNAFASTQRHAVTRRGNTIPRKAYMRQPAVLLSQEGHDWLINKLETAFQVYGKITPTEMEQLDWPELEVSNKPGLPI